MEFRFDLKAKKSRIRTSVILDALRVYAASKGNRPTTYEEWDEWPGRVCHSYTIIKRFGSWREALRRVGVEGARGYKFPAEELVAKLERLWRELGHPPTNAQICEGGRMCAGPYRRRWGTIQRACEMLAAFHAGQIDRETLLRGNLRPPVARDRPGMRRGVRWRVLERDGHRCVSCGRRPETDARVELEVDHIVPVCRGGTDEESNLRTLCRECNRGKRGRMDGEAGKP